MHNTTTRTIPLGRRALAVAAAILAVLGASLTLHATDASAAMMPDWAADFLAAGDAFEGSYGGGTPIASCTTIASGYYHAYVDGAWRKVLWVDRSCSGVPYPVRSCGYENPDAGSSTPLARCP